MFKRVRNNRGFSLIEILVSFVLIMIILVNMLSVVMNYKDKITIEELKSDMSTTKNTITRLIQNDITSKGLYNIEQISTNQVRLYFQDTTYKDLIISNVNSIVASEVRNKYIEYDGNKYLIRDVLPDVGKVNENDVYRYQATSVHIGRLLEKRTTESGTVFGIHISILSTEIEGDYGIHIVATDSLSSMTTSNGTLLSLSGLRIGDYVNYNPGNWTTTAAVPTTFGNFGGYTSGASKSAAVNCGSGASTLSGWRVLSIEGEVIKIVSSAPVECFYHTEGKAPDTEKIITGTNTLTTSSMASHDYTPFINTRYALTAEALNYNHLKKYVKGNVAIGATFGGDLFKVGQPYTLGTNIDNTSVYRISANGVVEKSTTGVTGVRVVVTLSSKVSTTGQNASGVWQLVAGYGND